MHSFEAYQDGIQRLLQELGQEHERYAEALTLQSRLQENLAGVHEYGDDENRRVSRAQIIESLNRLALETLRIGFNELCDVEVIGRPGQASTPDSTPGGLLGTDDSREPRHPARVPQLYLAGLPSCPFVAGPKITDPRLFVGRKEALRRMTTAMESAQPISINIVGERRIGKSSLLYHLYQTWEQRVRNPARYIVAYLSLQDAAAQAERDFYRAVARALLDRPRVQRYSPLIEALNRQPLDRRGFAGAMRAFQAHGLLPVLCLDEFEALLRRPRQFDDSFYDALRALMDDNVLMLVVSSLKPLDVYRRQHRLTSSFFNLGHVLILGELEDNEAVDLVRLPASTVRGARAALGIEEQRLARKWGGRHPYLLQLAAGFLCQAGQQGRDAAWARGRFEEQASAIPRRRFDPRRWRRPLRRVVWDAPIRLGRVARFVGGAADELTNWIIGMVVLIVVILALLGLLTRPQVVDLLRRALGG